MQKLNSQISSAISLGFIPLEVKSEISNNLNQKLSIRPYQIEAFSRFNFYMGNDKLKRKPTHLLFHMATGSGKTLVMAGIIIDLYLQGYRNFIFFVNSTNIIEKTKDNFLNASSSKYLFNESITIGDKKVEIKEVDNFEAVNTEDINIVFTTVQGLHARLNTPRENSITYEDFEDKKVVLLSDEAHHINADTKKGKLSSEEQESYVSWESTVNKIFNTNAENILLEFTATADLENENLKEKYADKLIFDYPLKQFRLDKYSKEVQINQADLAPFPRAIKAVLLSQFRRKIFEDHKLNIKPVILFKSKTIKDSQSFYQEFIDGIKTLKVDDLAKIKSSNTEKVFEKMFNYLEQNNITFENLILELQEDFNEEKCIAVDSKNDSEEKQLILNSLEDENNEYRAIFAVDKLNEGWDVLNLFDIVRLYDTRDADHKTGKIGKTTMSEAQLIGRGARYCPFQLDDSQEMYQRKYDEDIENPMRICEELYYHSSHNPKYIYELNKALEEIGIKAPKMVQRELKLKDSFKQTEFYKRGLIFTNEKVPYDRMDFEELPYGVRAKEYSIKFPTGYSSTSRIFEDTSQKAFQQDSKKWQIILFGEHVIRKAINKLPFYRFNNLQRHYPKLSSISEFINSDKFLRDISITISGDKELVHNPEQEVKLKSVIKILEEIAEILSKGFVDHRGSLEFKSAVVSSVFKDKTLNYSINEGGDAENGLPQSESKNTSLLIDLSQEDWYAFNENYGTSEEKYLVKFIKGAYDSLKNNYDDIYLLRNEKHFSIYDFRDGRAFEPDFVLFMKEKEGHKPIIFQTFIEPKGEHLIANDIWKQEFLTMIAEKHTMLELYSNREYRLLGLPFYNEKTKKDFTDVFNNQFIN